MRRLPRRRFFAADVSLFAAVGLVVLVLGLLSSKGGSPPRGTAYLTVLGAQPMPGVRPIPAGFLGVSLEYSTLPAYAGTDPAAPNPVFEQVLRNLAPGQAQLLRIGGDSADWTWWPVSGTPRPPGVTYTLNAGWIAVTRALSSRLHAQLMLGLNLEAGSPDVAAAEASNLLSGIGQRSVQALELGNEPELYPTFPWYHKPDGHGVPGRPRSYDFAAFTRDFSQFADALPPIPLAGPALGGTGWVHYLNQFLDAVPAVRVVTLHRYPLQLCFAHPSSPTYPTIGHLLAPASSTGLADLFAGSVATAHARGLSLRDDELNTVSCGAAPAISKSFASALWVLDTLFEFARVGIDGVNIHTFPGAGYELFTFSYSGGGWRGSVAPEYYGLLMFAQAAHPGSRLLQVSGRIKGPLKVWATRAPDGRIRVIMINKGTSGSWAVALRVPGHTRDATLQRLQAPSARATSGVTLGGRNFRPQTTTGTLEGHQRKFSVQADNGRYVVTLPAASAALLTLPR